MVNYKFAQWRVTNQEIEFKYCSASRCWQQLDWLKNNLSVFQVNKSLLLYRYWYDLPTHVDLSNKNRLKQKRCSITNAWMSSKFDRYIKLIGITNRFVTKRYGFSYLKQLEDILFCHVSFCFLDILGIIEIRCHFLYGLVKSRLAFYNKNVAWPLSTCTITQSFPQPQS